MDKIILLYNILLRPIKLNKKLSYRRETARRFVSLHSCQYCDKSLKVTEGHSEWHCWVRRV